MTNVLATAADWLSRMRQEHAASHVIYRRGAHSLEIEPQKFSVMVDQDRGDGVTVEVQRMDWIVAVEDLIFGGQRTEPAEGDQIEHWIGSTKYTYEVMPLGTDSHFRPVGPYSTAWRIHSKLVSVS